MEREFTHPLARNDQHRLIKQFIGQRSMFVHETYLKAFTILSSLTTDIVVVRGDCSFSNHSNNPCAIFYCNQSGRETLKNVFAAMNRKLKVKDRFRNQLFEGTCYHDVVDITGKMTNLEVNYVGWSYNHLFVTKKECYKIIALFCETLLDELGVYRHW